MTRQLQFRWIIVGAIVAFAAAIATGGCHAAQPLLADLFIPLPPSAPVSNSPRHPPPVKAAPMVIVQAEIIKPPDIDYAGIYQALPRDSKGVVDWMGALTENTITPKPGINPEATPARTTDSEFEFFNTATPGKTATFRHATHTQWLSCKNCHNSIFKKSDENLQFTHDDMEQKGLYCGACHFKVVVVQGGCKGCHAKKKSEAGASVAASAAS